MLIKKKKKSCTGYIFLFNFSFKPNRTFTDNEYKNKNDN